MSCSLPPGWFFCPFAPLSVCFLSRCLCPACALFLNFVSSFCASSQPVAAGGNGSPRDGCRDGQREGCCFMPEPRGPPREGENVRAGSPTAASLSPSSPVHKLIVCLLACTPICVCSPVSSGHRHVCGCRFRSRVGAEGAGPWGLTLFSAAAGGVLSWMQTAPLGVEVILPGGCRLWGQRGRRVAG